MSFLQVFGTTRKFGSQSERTHAIPVSGKVQDGNVRLRLTWAIAPLLGIAAGCGVFIHGLYRDTPYFVAQAVAQDFISFTVVLPTLAMNALLASRGSQRAQLVWLGALVYF